MAKLLSEVKLQKLGRHHDVSADGVQWQRASDVEGLFVNATIRKRVGRPAPGNARVEVVEATEELELESVANPAASSAAMWHYSVHDQQFGPVREDDLVRDVEAGRLPLDALVWREGYADWVMIEESPDLMARLDNPWRSATAGASVAAATRFVDPVVGPHHSFPVAYGEHPGFWLRLVAHVIDSVLTQIISAVALAFGFVIAVTMAASGESNEGVLGFVALIVGLVISAVSVWLYYALFESSSKQGTPGKLACGFVVTDMNGDRISFGKATGRYFGMILSALTLGVGFIMCAFTERKQCLHDMLAGCLMYKKNG